MKTTKIVITLLILIIAVLLGIEMFTGRSAEPDLTDVTDKKDETSSPIYSETDTSPVNGHSDSSEIPNSSSDIPVSSESDSSDIPDITNLFPFPEKGIPVLMYHSICTDSKNSLCVSEKQFNEEMEWLYNNNYHPLSIDELYNALVQGIQIPEKPILITFDDGYLNNYQAAWPILQKYGFHATFFIIINMMGSDYMDWDQLKELVNKGNSIGSHTVHHLDLANLSEEKQKQEMSESKQILEEHLGISIKALCFPSGKYNETTVKLLPELGYSLGFTTKPGRVFSGNSQYELHRVRIPNGMSLTGFINSVSY